MIKGETKMKDGWKSYEGKKVFLELKSGRVYSGRIKLVQEQTESNPITWIYLVDKFGMLITIVSSEIKFIQEERE